VYLKWEHFNYDARAVLEADDFIIVPVIARAKALNGYSMENEHLFLFQVRDGQIVHGRLYADTARRRDILEDRPAKRYPKLILD
jgi:ketosteroid isomerase-like protein